MENMEEKKRIVKYRGEFELAGFKLTCFNLEDGTRYLSSNSIQLVLKMVDKDDKQERGPKLKYFLNQKSLKPFVDEAKGGGTFFEPDVLYDGGVKINGFKATTLPDICNIYRALEK